MKQLFLIRHAKSSWDDMSLSDFDRPLNKRGKRDAPKMGDFLREKSISPDLIVSSPANRALTTAKIIAEKVNYAINDIVERKSIYHAFPTDVIDVIHALPDDKNTVFLFGHNPTFTSLANKFGGVYIDNVPTCGVVALVANIDSWSEWNAHVSSLGNFYYPKKDLI